ncbi:hypothetical protein J5J86_10970 [Aquabacter sp. L1I39]|uniref:hypothetical protein n=1 Tax=Aquabacter sp. L1I39 TaxID=2820278 RepID=UPI001ADB39F5|nr:hypothetical protein [Aquabacter sp. L1I39]QTL05762.1 hypothetical protein J5J86_10970 [Aquabacter sp. L1I39]
MAALGAAGFLAAGFFAAVATGAAGGGASTFGGSAVFAFAGFAGAFVGAFAAGVFAGFVAMLWLHLRQGCESQGASENYVKTSNIRKVAVFAGMKRYAHLS